MKRVYIVFVIILSIYFAACSSTKGSTDVWVNNEKIQGKSYDNIFIVVMTADIQARVQMEKDLEAVAIAKGYKAVKSMDVLPPIISDPKIPTREEIVSKVKASGCNAVFVASLINKDEAVSYTQGGTTYSAVSNYSYTGNYYGYYSNTYTAVSHPSYYKAKKKYIIQSNLYDVASEAIMWSAKSEVFNPSDLPKFSKSYISALLTQLEKAKILKK